MARTSRLKITPHVECPTSALRAPEEARPRRRSPRTAWRARASRSGRTRISPDSPSICKPAKTPIADSRQEVQGKQTASSEKVGDGAGTGLGHTIEIIDTSRAQGVCRGDQRARAGTIQEHLAILESNVGESSS
eukprot:4742379-Pyramimonas_sp.AAC.1